MKESVDKSARVIVFAEVLMNEYVLLFSTPSGAQPTDPVDEIVDHRQFLIARMEGEIVKNPAG